MPSVGDSEIVQAFLSSTTCRDLTVGDLVLRLRQSNKGRHKLTPPWEGPYIVAQVLKLGSTS